MTGPVMFEINGDNPAGPKRGVITGQNIRPIDAIRLIETLDELGWPVPPGAVAQNYKDAFEEVLIALKDTVEYVGTDTLPAHPGWSWFEAMRSYAPDWPIPKNKGEAAVDESDGLDASTDVFKAWAKDATVTDYEQYQKGWLACVAFLKADLERIRTIGVTPSGAVTPEDHEFYDKHPLPFDDRPTVESIMAHIGYWLNAQKGSE